MKGEEEAEDEGEKGARDRVEERGGRRLRSTKRKQHYKGCCCSCASAAHTRPRTYSRARKKDKNAKPRDPKSTFILLLSPSLAPRRPPPGPLPAPSLLACNDRAISARNLPGSEELDFSGTRQSTQVSSADACTPAAAEQRWFLVLLGGCDSN